MYVTHAYTDRLIEAWTQKYRLQEGIHKLRNKRAEIRQTTEVKRPKPINNEEDMI